MARILLASTGSLGDLHPFLALARGLQARGHAPVLAVPALYRERVEAAGLAFAPLRPDPPDPEAAPEAMARAMHPMQGPEFIWREFVVPAIRESHADLLAAAAGCDLILSNPIVPAAPMVAEQLGIPWAPVALQPAMFFSAHELLVPAPAPWMARLHGLSRWLAPLQRRLVRRVMRDWLAPLRDFRAELGLPPALDPMLNAAGVPGFGLALFSPLLGHRQPDWPPETAPTGFCFWEEEPRLPVELRRFLAAGPPPLLFTLGSAAVFAAGDFYRESLEAARLLGRRALLLSGPARNLAGLPQPLPDWALAVDYVPHAAVMPRAAAIIHQGGVGTCAQAMRAGRPMLVVPFSHDQPDNAARLRRLGIAAILPPHRYRAARAAAALAPLLEEAAVEARAGAIGQAVRAEDGVGAACGVVEQHLPPK